MFEKLIIRNKVYREGVLGYNLIQLISSSDETLTEYDENSHEFNEDAVIYGETLFEFRERLSDKQIIEKIFDEEIDTERLEDSTLYAKYREIEESGQDNEYFRTIYKVSENWGASIESHTYLYYISNLYYDEIKMFPWNTVCVKQYIADTWWETDDEILHDMTHLSFIDYIEKYRMFR